MLTMNTYCEGTHCDKRSHCALHCVGPGDYEYIDWSTYGSGSFIKYTNGNNQSIIEHSCGNLSNFKHYIPLLLSSCSLHIVSAILLH